MKKEIKGLRKLNTEEMEKAQGGQVDCFLAALEYGLASQEYYLNPNSNVAMTRFFIAQGVMIYECQLI